MQEDFREYYKWSQWKDMQDLEEWILEENTKLLEEFVVRVTGKYLGTK